MLGGRAHHGTRARGDEERFGWQLKKINVDCEVDLHGAMGYIYVMDNAAVRREMSVQEDFLAQGSQSASVISWLEPAQLSNARVVGCASGLESMFGAHLEVHSL